MDLSRRWTIEKILEIIHGRPLQGNFKVPVRSISIDSRKLTKGELFWAIEGARNGNNFVADAAKKGAIGAVVTGEYFEGLARNFSLIRVPHGLSALGRMAQAHRLLFPKLNVVGVTGSNGKTTTKEMIGRVLERFGPTLVSPGNYNNEIGCPLSLLEISEKHCHAVVEMAARKPGDIAALSLMARINTAVITNISLAHLASFGSEENVFSTKAEVLKGILPGGNVIFWAEDPWLTRLPQLWPQYNFISFGMGPNAQVQGRVISESSEGTQVEVSHRGAVEGKLRLPMTGLGQVLNALAAVACGAAAGVSAKAAVKALDGFAPVAMRGEKLSVGGRFYGRKAVIVNDAYNANPASMTDSATGFLRSYKDWRRVLVLGEMRELGADEAQWHRKTGESLAQAMSREDGVSKLATIFVTVGGSLAQALADGLGTAARNGVCKVLYATKKQALDVIKTQAMEGKEPVAVFFKGSRAEALETLIPELKKFFN